MERAEWLLLMNTKCKLLAMAGDFTRAISQALFPKVLFPNFCTSTVHATPRDVGRSELSSPVVGSLTRQVTRNALAVTIKSLVKSRLKVTDLHGRISLLRVSWSRVELGTERESLLQVLDENANFGGQPAAGGPYGKDWHCSLKGSQKTDDRAFSEFCGEEPCWRLGNPQMFQDTHAHLFNIAGSKDSCGDNTRRVLSRAKAPRLYGASLDEHDRSKMVEVFRRSRCTMS